MISLHYLVTGRELSDVTTEYRLLNPALGLLLLGAVVISTVRRSGQYDLRWFLLLVTWGVFGFFTLIQKGDPPYRLAPLNGSGSKPR